MSEPLFVLLKAIMLTLETNFTSSSSSRIPWLGEMIYRVGRKQSRNRLQCPRHSVKKAINKMASSIKLNLSTNSAWMHHNRDSWRRFDSEGESVWATRTKDSQVERISEQRQVFFHLCGASKGCKIGREREPKFRRSQGFRQPFLLPTWSQVQTAHLLSAKVAWLYKAVRVQ